MENRAYGYMIATGDMKQDSEQKTEYISYVDERDLFIDSSGSREQYNSLLNSRLSDGDFLYINDLYCLGKTVPEMTEQYSAMCQKGVRILMICCGQDGSLCVADIDSEDIFKILFAHQMRQKYIQSDKCRKGIEAARNSGKRIGRPSIPLPDNWESVITELFRGSISSTEAMKKVKMKRNTFYKNLSKYRPVRKDNSP